MTQTTGAIFFYREAPDHGSTLTVVEGVAGSVILKVTREDHEDTFVCLPANQRRELAKVLALKPILIFTGEP